MHTHTHLSMLAVRGKSSTEDVCYQNVYTCSHSKQWEIILNIDTIIAAILKNITTESKTTGHKPAWYSFKVLTNLGSSSIIGASKS